MVSPLVYSPMMMIAVLLNAATATLDLADDNDPIFFHDLLSYILISAVDVSPFFLHQLPQVGMSWGLGL